MRIEYFYDLPITTLSLFRRPLKKEKDIDAYQFLQRGTAPSTHTQGSAKETGQDSSAESLVPLLLLFHSRVRFRLHLQLYHLYIIEPPGLFMTPPFSFILLFKFISFRHPPAEHQTPHYLTKLGSTLASRFPSSSSKHDDQETHGSTHIHERRNLNQWISKSGRHAGRTARSLTVSASGSCGFLSTCNTAPKRVPDSLPPFFDFT